VASPKHQVPAEDKAFKRLLKKAAVHTSATLVESLHVYSAALPSAIKPVDPRLSICAPAFPVSTPPGDNLAIHQAIYAAAPGDVLVVDTGGLYEAGYWGDVMTHAARARRLGGLVIDGSIRDIREISTSRFPVFARGACIRGTTKKGGGTVGEPIMIGDTKVTRGDLVVGDRDGVVIIPRAEVARVLEAATARVDREARAMKELSAGKATTLGMYKWPSA